MSNTVASQLVCNDFPALTTMIPQQPPEKALSRLAIPTGLQKYIYHLTILIDCSP
jgi:hypothetical protein